MITEKEELEINTENKEDNAYDKFLDWSEKMKKATEGLEETCDKFFKTNENSTLAEIANSLEYHEKKRNNKRLNEIEVRLDKIEKRLKENNIK